MYCKNCGTKLDNDVLFCPNCGTSIKREAHNWQTKEIQKAKSGKSGKKVGKLIIIFVCIMAVLVLAAFGISNAYKVYMNKPENKFKKTTENFLDEIEAGKYSDAKKFIVDEGNVEGSFEDFAKEFLKGASIIKKGDNYILKGKEESYTLKSNEKGDKITTDDFYMEYKIKTSTYLKSKANSGTSEVLEDGMTLYTIKAYKTHELEAESCVAWGDDIDSLLRIAHAKVTTDDDYNPVEITDKYLMVGDNEESYDDIYIDDDGAIVFDKYYMPEDFAETVARTFTAMATDMSDAVLWNEDFEQFYSGYNQYMFETDQLKSEYEGLADWNSFSKVADSVDYTATSWNYPTEFTYSNGNCVLNIKFKLTITKNNKDTVTSGSYYVLFKPGKDRFKVFSMSDTESGLYDAALTSDKADISDIDTTDMKDWQQAYVDYLTENQENIGHASLGYVDDDDIPELFICEEESPSHGCGVKVLSYINGQVTQITASTNDREKFGSNGVVSYYEKSGIIWSSYSGRGEVDNDYYQLNSDGKAELILSCSITDVDMPEQTKYYVNDKECTSDEYEHAMNGVVQTGAIQKNAPEEKSVSDVINEISSL